jgi:hypothetical protein
MGVTQKRVGRFGEKDAELWGGGLPRGRIPQAVRIARLQTDCELKVGCIDADPPASGTSWTFKSSMLAQCSGWSSGSRPELARPGLRAVRLVVLSLDVFQIGVAQVAGIF